LCTNRGVAVIIQLEYWAVDVKLSPYRTVPYRIIIARKQKKTSIIYSSCQYTWLSRPTKNSIRKNRIDHRGDTGSWATAEG